jgi:hypothetical protein
MAYAILNAVVAANVAAGLWMALGTLTGRRIGR